MIQASFTSHTSVGLSWYWRSLTKAGYNQFYHVRLVLKYDAGDSTFLLSTNQMKDRQ